MTEVCMIVAATRDGIIGVNNQLPWNLPEDLAYFKNKTMGHPVIMGRKTFESIGRPLPGRPNYVLTTRNEPIPGVTLLNGVSLPSELVGRRVFIIGGSEVYRAFEDRIDEIYLTEVHLSVEGDARLPFKIVSPTWKINSAEYQKTKSGVVVCYQHWSRNKNE